MQNPPSRNESGGFRCLASEGCFVELHDVVVDGLQHLAGCAQQRQEVLREERRDRDLALVEGPVGVADAGVSDADRAFYEGKIAVASFFAKNFLPLLSTTRQVLETIDNDIMELDEAAF